MIRVNIDGTEYSCEPGQLLGDFLRDVRPDIAPAFVCGGHGKCGKCRIIVASGAASPVSPEERRLLGDDDVGRGVRLACMTRIEGDIRLASYSYAASGGEIRIAGELPAFRRIPAFKKYGIALDIGTTTLAAILYDADGAVIASGGSMNPQSKYGADVVSRMEYALKGGGGELTEAIRERISELIAELCCDAGIGSDKIDGAVVTGNTVMLSFFAGIDTEPMTHAPFIPHELFGKTYTANECGIDCLLPETPVYLPPCAAAFIGADVMCATLADLREGPGDCELLADIGTNGEMIWSAGGKLFACSTAAGPAFEGAGISSGMGGFDGAVDRVKIGDGGRLEAHIIGEEKGAEAKGICGSGLIDAVRCLRELEIVDETGYMEDGSAEIKPGVSLNQKDIRAVQLAKSAIHAGILSLLNASKTSPDSVKIMHIAGGFGSFLNVESAGRIGLIPDGFVRKTHISGNAALAGASMLLLSLPMRSRIRELTGRVHVLELSTDDNFVNAFMEQMMFP